MILFRINFELETRDRELKTLKEQLNAIQNRVADFKKTNSDLADRIDAIGSECSAIDQECMDIMSSKLDHVHAPMVAVSGRQDSARGPSQNASAMKFQFPAVNDQGWVKSDQRLLSEISGNSSALGELMNRACEMEMERTRALDVLLENAEEALEVKTTQIREIAKLVKEMRSLRKEYDAQLVDDFQVLCELALTMESLEQELERESRGKKKDAVSRKKKMLLSNQSVVVPIRESTLQLQDQVARLERELAGKQEYYEGELQKVQKEVKDTKARKIKVKSNFQQKLKGIFKDFEFISERTDKAEAALEKAHLHYQLEEDEIVSVVSPIIESIDRVRERVDILASDAEEALYGIPNQDN